MIGEQRHRAQRVAVNETDTKCVPTGDLLNFLSYRRGTIQLTNIKGNFQIRQDSPKTKEACLSLGLDSNQIFAFKTVEDFSGPNVPEHIKRLRYEHYINKLKTDLTEVAKRRRLIIRNHQSLNNLDLLSNEAENETSKMGNKTTQKFHLKHADPAIVEEMMSVYTRTVGNFENLQLSEISENSDAGPLDPVELLEVKLRQAVSQYQRAQLQKSKEMSGILTSDAHRHKMNEDLANREARIESLKAELANRKTKNKKRLRKIAEEKMEKIHDKERQYMNQQQEERAKQSEKLEKLREKLAQEEEKRKLQLVEHEQKLKMRQERAIKNKQSQDHLTAVQMNQTFHDIMNKCFYCIINRIETMNQQRYLNFMQSRTEKLQHRQSLDAIKRTQLQRSEEKKQKQEVGLLINRLVQKEELLRCSFIL